MRFAIAVLFTALLLVPCAAEDKRPKYQPWTVDRLINHYDTEGMIKMIEAANEYNRMAALQYSKHNTCFEVTISTRSPFHGPPYWELKAGNCVDKRVYTCEEDGKE